MKKMKFTLGLMLSMLLLGANVGYAQTYEFYEYDHAWPHNGAILLAIDVHGCDFYKSISAAVVAVDDASGYPFSSAATVSIGLPKLGETVSMSFPANSWKYGSGLWESYPKDYRNGDYYFHSGMNQYVTNGSGGNLFYYLEKSNTQVYNQLEVELDYENGNELQPILKRYMLLGEWVTVLCTDPSDINFGKYQNVLFPTNIVIEQEIDFDKELSRFRPDMDRGGGPAKYVFRDQILPLLDKYIIFAMGYELAVYDEFDTIGRTVYPPSQTLPKDSRKVYIETADGVKTNPSSLGSAIYVPSLQNFVFTATSQSEITAETITLHQPFGNFDEIRLGNKKGVIVKNNNNGTYTITIQQVNQEMLIRINTVASLSSGDTGNEAFAADAVWAASGSLFVQAANPATLSVYTVTGQLFFQTAVTGSYNMTLPKGLYIVQLNGKAYKVVN